MGEEEKKAKSTWIGYFKGALIGSAILAGMAAWIHFGTRRESNWAQNTVDSMFRSGWSLASADHNTTLTLETPWRLWTSHVSGLAFVKRSEILQLGGGIRVTEVAFIRMSGYEGMSFQFHDCRNGQFASISEDVDPRTVNVRELDWQDAANPYGSPSILHENLQTFVCFVDIGGTVSPYPKSSIRRALDGWPKLQERGGV